MLDMKKPGSLAGRERSGYGHRVTGAAMRDFIRLMRARGGPKRATFGEVCLYLVLLYLAVLWIALRFNYVMWWW